MKSAIIVSKLGVPEEIQIEECFLKNISNNIKFKGKIENINTWHFNDLNISLYGYRSGKSGNENKFETPPPTENTLFFGDIIFINTTKQHIQNLNMSDFTHFYNETMGGFEDIEDSETLSSNDTTNTEDSFIVNKQNTSTESDWTHSEEDDDDEDEDDEDDDDEDDDDEDDDDDDEEDDDDDDDEDDDEDDELNPKLSNNLFKYTDNCDLISYESLSELSEEEVNDKQFNFSPPVIKIIRKKRKKKDNDK